MFLVNQITASSKEIPSDIINKALAANVVNMCTSIKKAPDFSGLLDGYGWCFTALPW